MTGVEIVALVSVVVSPVAVLVAVWLSLRSKFAAEQQPEPESRAGADAIQALGPFAALALDAEPEAVVTGELRGFSSPNDAMINLWARWRELRKPMIFLSFTHPSLRVRERAFTVQSWLEIVLEKTEEAIKFGDSPKRDEAMQEARKYYLQVHKELHDLAKQLSPWKG